MIPAASPALQPATPPTNREHADWKRSWREAVRDPRELLAMLGLEHLGEHLSDDAAAQYPNAQLYVTDTTCSGCQSIGSTTQDALASAGVRRFDDLPAVGVVQPGSAS